MSQNSFFFFWGGAGRPHLLACIFLIYHLCIHPLFHRCIFLPLFHYSYLSPFCSVCLITHPFLSLSLSICTTLFSPLPEHLLYSVFSTSLTVFSTSLLYHLTVSPLSVYFLYTSVYIAKTLFLSSRPFQNFLCPSVYLLYISNLTQPNLTSATHSFLLLFQRASVYL